MAESTHGVRPPWFAGPALPALLVLVALAVGATPKIVGDGGEYLIYAVSIARGHLPPLSPRDLQEAGPSLARAAGGLRSWEPQRAFIPAESGRGDFAHFWFYPALAAPGALVARLAGVDPVWSFVLLNVALLFLAWRLAVARFGWAVSLLVCGGPVLWWIDKVHTEAFTFALLTIAVTSLRSRPWLSLVALGAAATQNPPIAALLVPFAAAGLWITRARLNWRQTIAGLAGGVLFAALHPAYYLLVHGTPSLLAYSSKGAFPGLSESGAVLWDTNIGLVFGHPLFVAAIVVSMVAIVVRRPAALADAELAASAAALPVFLFAFSQTVNVQHGATPGMSRYALWLLPLTLRLFDLARTEARARTWLEPWAALSFLVCLVAYHPSVAEGAYRPSYASRWLWTRAPGYVRPLPEIFSETVRGDDGGIHVPVAMPGCEKVLLEGGPRERPMWPVPCYPAVVPDACQGAGTLCYANRTPRGYAFDVLPRAARSNVQFSAADTWSQAAEPIVRRLLDAAVWPSLRPGPEQGSSSCLRAVEHVGRVWDLQSEQAVVLVAKGTAAGARVFLRLPRSMEGAIVDAESGAEIGWAAVQGPSFEPAALSLPEHDGLLLVVLR